MSASPAAGGGALDAIARAAAEGGSAGDTLERIGAALTHRVGLRCRIVAVPGDGGDGAAHGAAQVLPSVVSGPVEVALHPPGRSGKPPVALLRLETSGAPTPLQEPLADVLPLLALIIDLTNSSRRAQQRARAAEAVLAVTRSGASARPLSTLLRDALASLAGVLAADSAQLYGPGGRCLLGVRTDGVAAPPTDAERAFARSALDGEPRAQRTRLPPRGDEAVDAGSAGEGAGALAAPALCHGRHTRVLLLAFRASGAFDSADEAAACAIAAEVGRTGAAVAAASAESGGQEAVADSESERQEGPEGSGAELASAFRVPVPAHAAPPPAALRGIPEPTGGVLVRGSYTPAALTWDLDTLSPSSDQLCSLAEEFFDHWNCVRQFHVPRPALHAFLFAAASNYRANPYHNWAHVLSVVHYSFMMGQVTAMRGILTPLDKFALLVAAVGHDLDHPGHNNDYECKVHSDLALRYNDASVLENHHAALLFSLMRTRCAANGYRDCHVLQGLDAEQYSTARRRIIGAILATDMARHGSIVERIKGLDPSDPFPNGGDEGERQFAANVAIHCADLCNPVFPDFGLVRRWAGRVCSEFHGQTEREETAGVPVTGWMKGLTNAVSVAKAQVFFANGVVAPMWEALAESLPAVEPLVTNLHRNCAYWKRIGDGEDPDAVEEEARKAKAERDAQERGGAA